MFLYIYVDTEVSEGNQGKVDTQVCPFPKYSCSICLPHPFFFYYLSGPKINLKLLPLFEFNNVIYRPGTEAGRDPAQGLTTAETVGGTLGTRRSMNNQQMKCHTSSFSTLPLYIRSGVTYDFILAVFESYADATLSISSPRGWVFIAIFWKWRKPRNRMNQPEPLDSVPY